MKTFVKYFFCTALLPFIACSTTLLHAKTNLQNDTLDLQRYIWLNIEGMNDTETPNEEIHELITAGLQHENLEIVHCTVSALSMFIGKSKQYRKKGLSYPIDRDLKNIQEWRDVLITMWNENWSKSGKIFPTLEVSDELIVKIQNKTACFGAKPTWAVLPQILAYLYPQDFEVYEIIWDAFPEPPGGFSGGLIEEDNNPLPLLSCLFEGQFNNEKDQKLRINLLSNRKISRSVAQLAARSLGEFRSNEGLEALADTLKTKGHEYGTPNLELVESIMKYEEQATQYIPLLQENLTNVLAIGEFEKNLLATLKERLIHFEEKHGEIKTENDRLNDLLK